MKKILCLLCILVGLECKADATDADTLSSPYEYASFREIKKDSTLNFGQKIKHSGGLIKRFIKAFDAYDTTYIEPNKYHMTVMLQGTGNAEWFSLTGEESGHRMSFTSRPGYKIGPYLGWHWIFLGYTIDVSTIGGTKTKKTETEFSLYSSMLGCDLFYRKTGSDFTLRRAAGYDQDLKPYYGMGFDGIKVSLIGLNAYYIANHKHFSLPAAFSQSTRQLRSAGSWKFGFSITRHDINIDYQKLNEQIPGGISQDMQVTKMKYMDYSLSAGYAYNWVFSKDWLLSVDLAPSIGYKRTSRSIWSKAADPLPEGATRAGIINPQDNARLYQALYERGNINFNVTGRLGIVWNNSRNYAGASLIIHNFNYRHRDLSMHNAFLSFNVYTGLNFLRQKK